MKGRASPCRGAYELESLHNGSAMTKILHKDAMDTELWNTFTADPTTGVALLSVEGDLLYINEPSARIFYNVNKDPNEIIGLTMYELGFPQEWARERLELFKKIRDTGESVLLRTIWHGKQQFSWMSLIKGDEEYSLDRILVITRRIAAGEESQYLLEGEHDVFQSNIMCLGELKSLTPREVEVLSLLGQGMTIKEIATALFRSVKTIENHRESIGRKLKKTRGIELAVIAQSAGLRVDDSIRKRVGEDKPCKSDPDIQS